VNTIIINSDKIESKYEEIIKKSINKVINYLGYEDNFEVSVVITDNEGIKKINAEFRDIDKETDVLSFPMMEFDDEGNMVEDPYVLEEEERLLGDIVLSLEKASEQAQLYGHGIEREISFLIVHSMLHLFGFDHIEENDRLLMRAEEEKILNEMGYAINEK